MALVFLLAVLLFVVVLIAIFAFPSEKVSRWLTQGSKEATTKDDKQNK